MPHARRSPRRRGHVAAAAALVLLPALLGCGKRGDPLPPLPRTPQAVTGFTLAQRGSDIEVAMVAPRLTAGNAPLGVMELELVRLDGPGDLEKSGKRQRFKAGPGERLVERFPLPEKCTLVRVLVRAIHKGERSPASKPLTLVVNTPPAPPPTLTTTLRPGGVLLAWTLPATPSPAPTPCPTPTPSPAAAPAAHPAPGASPRPLPSSPVSPVPAPPASPAPPGPPPSPGASPAPAAVATPATPTPPPPPPRVRLYRRGPEGTAALLVPDPLAGVTYEDTTAPQGQTWCYVARTVAGTDPLVESAESAPACVEVKDVFPPAAPTGLSVLAQDAEVEVSWSPSPEDDLKTYRLYRQSGGPPQRVAEIAKGTTSLRDKPPPGAVSVYTLTAVDGNGNESPPSAPVSIRRP